MRIFRKVLEFVMDVLETITFVGSIFIVIYLFIVGPNQVRGESMVPTFESGEYILTSRITYKFRPIHRGDIIVFKSPKNPDIEFIKRVIGLPGDTIRIQDGIVYVNNDVIQEEYIHNITNTLAEGFLQEGQTFTVPPDELFVMGDNRQGSSDSREFGPVPKTSIVGEVFYRYYPADKMGPIENPLPKSLWEQTTLPSHRYQKVIA